MHLLNKTSIALLSFAIAQVAFAGNTARSTMQPLPPKTTLPIVFTRSLDANHARVGEAVLARTTQEVRLPSGEWVPAGAQVGGHVVEANAFVFDRTPYAKQKQSALAIHFDTLRWGEVMLPLNVYVRAMADPVTSWDAVKPMSDEDDSLATTMQIGGDIVTPSQAEVVSRDGDVVGYRRHGSVYAHLIASTGDAPNGCDASDTEESMGLYSASACGLYGFTGNDLEQTGKGMQPPTLVIVSERHAPKVWKNSTALLEVLPANVQVGSR